VVGGVVASPFMPSNSTAGRQSLGAVILGVGSKFSSIATTSSDAVFSNWMFADKESTLI
jgi:hypothetical protein